MKRMSAFFIAVFLTPLIAALLPAAATADWINPHDPRYGKDNGNVLDTVYPICPRPQGETKAFYAEGIHAIVGHPETKKGSDLVISIGNDNFVQCFCPEKEKHGKKGIQTDWLAVANAKDLTLPLSYKEKVHYRGEKWYYIENGADWGLPPVPYLAKNSKFHCIFELEDPNE